MPLTGVDDGSQVPGEELMNLYGFDWGPMKVERLAHIEGRGYVLSVKTDHAEMQVYVSEKGRVVRPYPVRENNAAAYYWDQEVIDG
jgi:hypothetical protein